jgi:hypothetical protein
MKYAVLSVNSLLISVVIGFYAWELVDAKSSLSLIYS